MGFRLSQQRDLYHTEWDMGALTNIPWKVKEIFTYRAGKLAGAHTGFIADELPQGLCPVPDFEPHSDFMIVCEQSVYP